MKLKKPPLAPAQLEARLRQAGIQATAQRLAIARYVLCEGNHPSAEEVKEWADQHFPKMSLATVYNTLGVLVKGGILKELRLPHSDRVLYDDRVADHHHFLDETTGELMDVLPEQVDVATRLDSGLEIKGIEVLLRGRKARSPRGAKR